MRVLISAYACEPGKGSEPEVGLRILLAAASQHDVWLLTRSNNLAALEEFLAGHPRSERIGLIGLDHDGMARRLKNLLGAVGIQWYYRQWQRRATRAALALDEEFDFDLIHHATFATLWAPVGIAALDKPLVLGPLGGGVRPPRALMRDLGVRGVIAEVARLAVRRLARLSPRLPRVMGKASLVLAQNRETAALVRAPGRVRVVSNATAIDLDGIGSPPARRRREMIFAARLIPWKGAVMAVRVLRYLEDEGVSLVILGEGPDRRRLERMAENWDVAERLRLPGRLPRNAALEQVRTAGVLIHTALHEEASLSVAEALSLGTPVVTYDFGGPAQVVQSWPSHLSATITPTTIDRTARALAEAAQGFLDSPPPLLPEPMGPTIPFSDAILQAYDGTVRPSVR